jgi:hypothetical protein
MDMAGDRYTILTRSEIEAEFAAIARDTRSVFGSYDAAQLNWQPQAGSWSIAQCFDHLIKTNHGMVEAMARTAGPASIQTIWQKLPLWPALMGRMLVSSQAPGGKRKFVAPASAQPTSSTVAPDVLERFVAWQDTGMSSVRGLGVEDARRIMVSPFLSQITYSVLDGWRLIAAHQRRHFEQARRVAEHPQFPSRH